MLKPAQIPGMLVGMRFAIAPLLVWDALVDSQAGVWFLVAYLLAVLADIFDGIIARRLGVSSPELRQADSWADICLYLAIAVAAITLHGDVMRDWQVPLLLAIVAQLSLFTLSLIKFGQMPSFHTYTAKAWGLSLMVATVALFGFGYTPTLGLAIALCLINSAEEIAMVLLLPEWRCDVLSIFHALRLRHKLLAATRNLIIFDFDGTIADSVEVFIRAANQLSQEFGLPKIDAKHWPLIQNMTSRQIIEKIPVPRWQLPLFLQRFRRELTRMIPDLQAVSGMQQALEELRWQGYRLGIVTSNTPRNVEAFLQSNGLRPLFEFIDAGHILTGKAEILRQFTRRYGLKPNQVIYVGDETRDIEAAHRAGVQVIAVSWGINSPTVLTKHQPDLLIDRPEQLPQAVRTLQTMIS